VSPGAIGQALEGAVHRCAAFHLQRW
jgi:hypothetical protein